LEDKLNNTEENSLTFGEIYAAYYKKKISKLAIGTRFNYERYIRLHFQAILNTPIKNMTSRFIDSWIDSLHESLNKTLQAKQRTGFKHELQLMQAVLKFYDEYYDDPDFKYPVKKRHAEDCQLKKSLPKYKDLLLVEFEQFRIEILKCKHGELFAAMATVQFYHALRISEAAALHFEDLNLNFKNSKESTIRICRHLVYLRKKGSKPILENGFKNAKGGENSVRELPLFPETFQTLNKVFKIHAKGLVFTIDGTALTYRQI